MKIQVAGLILCTAVILTAQERFDYKVRSYFFSGFAGDAASLKKGMKICEDLLASDPKNAEAMVWHGAGLFFQSGTALRTGDRETRRDLSRRGLKEMDDAAELAPNDLGVRIVRGAVLLTAARQMPRPEMAQPLIAKGVTDFETAYSVQGPDLTKLPTHPHGELMIGLADGYSRLGDQEKAQAWFERIQKELPGTPYANSAAAWMEAKSPLAAGQAGCLGCHTGN